MQVDAAGWGGEGVLTAALIDALRAVEAVDRLRVEDAPASRADVGYTFVSNELFVGFKTELRSVARRRFGVPWPARVTVRQMTLADLAVRLGQVEGVGEPDYADDGLLQYLRTERIIPPYQTRGHKVVEMVRIYEAGTPRRD